MLRGRAEKCNARKIIRLDGFVSIDFVEGGWIYFFKINLRFEKEIFKCVDVLENEKKRGKNGTRCDNLSAKRNLIF